MKGKLALVGIIAAVFIFTPITIAVIFEYTGSQPQTNQGLVHVYVESSLHDLLLTELTQYTQDIEAQGYNATLISWSINDVTQLKAHLTNAYQQGLVGAVFVGDLPYAMARHWDTAWGLYRNYPCDLYLMDLDGSWMDTVIPNGIYDIDQNEHTNGTGDWTPEIWVSRISPSSIGVSGYNYTAAYESYFNRNYNLRHGITTRSHKALLYIDDDWSSYKDEWLSNFTAYTGSQVNCYWNNPATTSTNYLNNITSVSYEFVHLLVHSWPTRHLFGPMGSGTDGILWYHDLYGKNLLPLFYNLYACFSCNFTQINNTGTYYLFSGNTLTVIGSARDGGCDLYQPFYDALRDGKVIGDALRIWFHNPEIIKWNKQQLYYGMTILGDPLLTVYMT